MKRNNITILVFSLLLLILSVSFGKKHIDAQNERKAIELFELKQKEKERHIADSLQAIADSIQEKHVELLLSVKCAFIPYNPFIKNKEVATFVNAAKAYELTEDADEFSLYIGQINTESSAQHCYIKTHPKYGEIVKSPTGALGFAQIVPTTAFHYIRYEMDSLDRKKLLRIGARDLEWAINGNYIRIDDKRVGVPKETRKAAIEWLSDFNNNVALWAYIMKDLREKYGLTRALISYNEGEGGAKNWLEENPDKEHNYIQKINYRKKYFSLETDA